MATTNMAAAQKIDWLIITLFFTHNSPALDLLGLLDHSP